MTNLSGHKEPVTSIKEKNQIIIVSDWKIIKLEIIPIKRIIKFSVKISAIEQFMKLWPACPLRFARSS